MTNFFLFCKKKILRFPPEPKGFLHIGHNFSIYLNYFYSLRKGFFFLRYDDTNLSNINWYFYNFIKFDLLWLGIKWNKLEFFQNKMRIIYKILFYIIKKKSIFFKKNSILMRINFNYLKNLNVVCFLLKNTFFFKKNEITYFIKNKIIFRIKNKKRHYMYFPTYDFSQCFNDYFNKINFSICTSEFKINSKIYNYLLRKVNKKPIQIEFEKKKLKFNRISKRNLKKKFFFNLFYLRKIGIDSKNLFNICNTLGISKKISFLKFKDFKKMIIKKKHILIKCNLYLKNILLNIKKNLIFFVFANKKNINLLNKNFELHKISKNNFYIINFSFFNKKLFFNKIIYFKNYTFFCNKIIILKKKNLLKIYNFFVNKRHCLYDNTIIYKKSNLLK
ncbi:glutamate--tRNA ligase family protein [Candidatus Carsonella ruddii]|uniref:Glutamyl/glutaminyl-tRNA synthetase class Ib catalytic domain-containing protein n=1 Tax=Carsonella ruddii TaxID=114186 RepID=A0AAE7KM91_CARRU|nr:glutamate--tRNA ligase family protein [Candidatus Carsonella ruddii]QLK14056.1 hypothetical protein FK493_00470 [Candidatus Carsonella ruddii]